MTRLILPGRRALLLAAAAAMPAWAGMADWVNGVRIDAPLPPHQLSYLGTEPPPNPRLQLIDFWATWCAPCRESVPRLNAWHAAHAAKGLGIVGVTKEPRALVERALPSWRMQYAVALDVDARLHDALRIKALPYALFTNRQGRVLWRGQPEDIDDALILRLLAAEGG